MKWYKNLYVGESIEHKQKKIIWKIKHNAGLLNTYVIAFASNNQNILDIIPTTNLMQKAYPQKELMIIGIAGSYEEALELTRRIIDDTYTNTGKVDVYNYLKNLEVTN